MSRLSQLRSAVLCCCLVSCVRSSGEFSRAQCDPSDAYDDDHDGLYNCDDPDCWVYDVCLSQKSAAIGEMRGGLTGDQDSSAAGATAAPPASQTGDDSGVGGESDGSPVFVCGDSTSCNANQICIEGACVSVPMYATKYSVSITSAALPDQGPAHACFDNPLSVNSCLGPGILICGNCNPDPYVVVTLNGDVIATSNVVTDSVAPTWPDFTFSVTLKPTDELVFTVKDHDDDTPDQTIFWCVPDLSGLTVSSVVRCTPDPHSSPTVAVPGVMNPWSVTATFQQTGVTPE